MAQQNNPIGPLVEKLSDIQSKLVKDHSFSGAIAALTPDDKGNVQIPDIQPFEIGIKNYLSTYSVDINAYNRFNYLPLLDSGLEFLSRAISIREDGKSLSLRASNDLVEEFKLENDISLGQANLAGPIRAEIEAQKSQITSLQKLLDEMATYVKIPPKKKSEMQLAFEHRTLQLNLEKTKAAKDILEQRAQILEAGLQSSRILIDTLGRRKSTAGHALNTGERIAVAKKAFLQNIGEAYTRLLAASQGLRQVYPLNYSAKLTSIDARIFTNDRDDTLQFAQFPSITFEATSEIGYVDKLMAWARDTLFVLERIGSGIQEFRLLLSMETLVKQSLATAPNNNKSAYQFTLKESMFGWGIGALASPRLSKLSVHIVPKVVTTSTVDDYKIKHALRKGFVQLPNQKSYDNKDIVPPPYNFGDAGSIDESAELNSNEMFVNMNVIGEWVVSVSKHTHSEVSEAEISDIWIEVIVWGRAVVSSTNYCPGSTGPLKIGTAPIC